MAAGLQHREVPLQIRVLVGERVLDRVAHPGLGGQMHHPPGGGVSHQRRKGLGVGHVKALQAEARMVHEGLEAGLLQRRIVIGVEVVDAYDLLAPLEQPQGDEPTDESGCAGDDDQGRLTAPSPPSPRQPLPPPAGCESNPPAARAGDRRP